MEKHDDIGKCVTCGKTNTVRRGQKCIDCLWLEIAMIQRYLKVFEDKLAILVERTKKNRIELTDQQKNGIRG